MWREQKKGILYAIVCFSQIRFVHCHLVARVVEGDLGGFGQLVYTKKRFVSLMGTPRNSVAWYKMAVRTHGDLQLLAFCCEKRLTRCVPDA